MPIFNYVLGVRVCSYKLNLADAPPNTACSSTSARRLRPSLGHRTACVPSDAFSGLYLRTVCLSRLFLVVDTPPVGRIPQPHKKVNSISRAISLGTNLRFVPSLISSVQASQNYENYTKYVSQLFWCIQ